MNIKIRRLRTLLFVLPVVVMVGCATDTTKENTENTADRGVGIGSGRDLSGKELPNGAGKSERVYAPEDRMGETFGGDFDNPATLLSKRVIYFNYDNTDVSSEYLPIITAHANYLAQKPKIAIILEGHTDERGSREYNLALGERRAQAVRQMMQLNVAPNQIEVVSYGEERAAAMGHEESAWRLNRRVEIVYRRK